MVKYGLDPAGLQLGLMDTAAQAQALDTSRKGFDSQDVKGSFGSHTSVSDVLESWSSLIKSAGSGAERLSGAVGARAVAMRDAGVIIERGDAGMAEQARGALSRVSNRWEPQA